MLCSCCTQAGENPANYMLDVAGGSAAGTSSGPDFVELYKASQRQAEHAPSWGGLSMHACLRWE